MLSLDVENPLFRRTKLIVLLVAVQRRTSILHVCGLPEIKRHIKENKRKRYMRQCHRKAVNRPKFTTFSSNARFKKKIRRNSPCCMPLRFPSCSAQLRCSHLFETAESKQVDLVSQSCHVPVFKGRLFFLHVDH